MPESVFDAGSFRDPAGRIILRGDRVFRTVQQGAIEDFEFVEASGLLTELASKGWVIGAQPVDPNILGECSAGVARVIEHPRIPRRR